VAAGCGGGTGDGSDPGTVRAVATTTQVADLVREVGGEQVEVTQIMQPNTDPHDYEPRPSDVAAFAEADIVFKSGGHLDEWSEQLIEDSGSSATVVDLSSELPVRLQGGEHDHEHGGESEAGHSDPGHSHSEDKGHNGEGHSHSDEPGHAEAGHSEDSGAQGTTEASGETDPHWWHDPVNVTAATEEIEAALLRQDPSAEQVFATNADTFRTEIDSLDRAIARCFDAIPADQRKLVTDHDALGYFANRYDIEVVGAVIPALTTAAQPSAGDLAELEQTIEDENVKAVFPESSYSPQLADAVARDTGASTEYSLYGDSLAPEGSDAATWIGMMRENANSMALGFTGGERGCDFN
jgi:ABC-type Zn uptake system ZnuABC Zn-binding protein ZnuA